MTDGKKIVWILGAGFSKSLGGPLLSGLLTPESRDRVLSAWPNNFGDHDIARRVVNLYLGGVHGLDHVEPMARHWEHAEEFLERLDRAARDTFEAGILEDFAESLDKHHVLPRTPARTGGMFRSWKLETIRLTALKLMAAECCVFLRSADLKLERWQPYTAWAKSLTESDTIITFNYDRVPDLLSGSRRLPKQPFDIPVPGDVAQPVAAPRVLNLHGSVSWYLSSTGLRKKPKDSDEEALGCQHMSRFGMATPGPTKREMIEGTITLEDGSTVKEPLKPLWDAAKVAIRDAHTIVMVGYRMPPSDAYSRQWLIEALRENQRMQAAQGPRLESYISVPGSAPKMLPAVNPLVIHTVLGSNLNHEHSQRLKGMLEEVDPKHRIEVKPWPMFAEDFLALISRERLLQ